MSRSAIPLAALRLACRVPFPGRLRLVDRLVPHLATERRVRGLIGARTRIDLDLRRFEQRRIYFGLYEPDETAVIRNMLRPADTVLDVGAHIGYYSLLAAERVGPTGVVHAFEPVEENLATLLSSARLNGYQNIVGRCAGVSDKSGGSITVTAPIGAPSPGSASMWRRVDERTVSYSAPTVGLDDYVAEHRIDRIAFLKMDVEGAEPLVLRGADRLLRRPDGPAVLCEINPAWLQLAGSSGEAIVAFLKERGYTIHRAQSRRLEPVDGDRPLPLNIIALK